MPRTPNRDAGAGQEEELQFIEDLGSLSGTYAIGRVGNTLKGQDPTYGAFDLGAAAGASTGLGLAVFKTDGGLVYDSAGNVVIKVNQ